MKLQWFPFGNTHSEKEKMWNFWRDQTSKDSLSEECRQLHLIREGREAATCGKWGDGLDETLRQGEENDGKWGNGDIS